ncbi:MAG: lamin tail domain-containing protein [Phycisphaerales bacterium]
MRNVRPLSVSLLALIACAGTVQAQQVKISQIYGGGGNATAPFNRDFVEIFNAGGAPVDITGWSVQYASATGTTWSRTDLTGAVLQPGQYYLVQMTLTGTTGAALPTPDHTVTTSIAMSATVGKVALVSNTTSLTGACPTGAEIIDFVGFGTTANCNEGGANTAAPGNATAVIRNNAGCDDSNVNGNDFTVGAPNPRNTASTLNPCPLPPGSDLAVSIADAGVTQMDVNSSVAYAVTVSNFGPDATSDATLTVTIPANATFIESTPMGTPVGNTLTFNTGPLAVSGSAIYSITLRADSGTALVPMASVTGPAADAFLDNNSASDSNVIFDRTRVRAVIGGAASTAPCSAIDVASGGTETFFMGEVRALAADDADRVFYFSSGTGFWRVSYDDMANPVQIGTFSGPITTVSGGMAFDPIRRRLIASTTSSFYEVNRQTGAVTLLRAVGSGDFTGIEYDAVNDRVVATNDSTSTTNGLVGRGLYRLDVNSTEVPVFISGYPFVNGATLDTDIDGLAYGGGRWYPVADQTTWFYTFDEGTLSYLDNLPTNFVTDRTNAGAAYTEQLYVRPPGANLSTTVTSDTTDCTVSAGGMVTYTVTVRNLGPSSADNTMISTTLPAGTVFVSSVPSVTPVGQTAMLDVGSLGDGQTATLQITAMTSIGGPIEFSGSGSSTTTDAFASNNAGSTVIRVQPTPPATAEAKGVFSTFPGSNSVPGMPGVSFSDVVDMNRSYRSADGSFWIMSADTDIADATMDRVLLRGTSMGFEVVAQEGVTLLPNALPTTNFDVVTGINNAGNFCFSTDYDTTSTGVGKVVVKSVGGVLQFAAEQGQAALPVFAAAYGSAAGASSIQTDNTVSFYSNMTGVATANDTAIFSGDGMNLLAQEGITSPGGQIGAEFWESFIFSTVDRAFSASADGMHYCASGTLTGVTASDTVTIVDGNVVIQEGTLLPGSGFASNVSSIGMSYMSPDGTWMAYGSNADGNDWVVRNGALVAVRGQEIFPGAGINWAEAGFVGTYFAAASDSLGNYIVGGLTDAPDTTANAIIVLNGERIVLRENDPIDLDNNGIFDDDAYVHIFRDDFAFITDGGDLYFPVRVRSGASLCSGTPAESGQALVRVALNLNNCRQDFNNDGNVDPDDLGDFINCYFSVPPCDRADFNMDGNVDPDDLGDFINLYFGPPCS